MKKVSKILLIAFLSTVGLTIIVCLAFRGGHIISDVGNFLKGIQAGYSEFTATKDAATYNLLAVTIGLIVTALVVLFAIQVRRRKTVMLPIFALIVVVTGVLLILCGSNISSFIDKVNASGNNKTLLVLGGILSVLMMLEAVALTVIYVPLTFETAEFKANSKKTDKIKIADIVIASVLVVLFFPLMAFVGGSSKGLMCIPDFFMYLFFQNEQGSTAVIVLVYIFIIVVGFILYKLIRQKKSFVGPLFGLALLFIVFAYSDYWDRIAYNFTIYVSSGNFAQVLFIILLFAHLGLTILFGLYILADSVISLCEPKRLKLYNHREKYVYGDRRKFGDTESVVKEWEMSKNVGFSQGYSTVGAAPSVKAESVEEEIVSQGPADDLTDEVVSETVIEEVIDTEVIGEEHEEVISEAEIKEDDVDDSAVKSKALTPEEKDKDFRVKILALEPEKQARYNVVRNKLESYKKIKQRFSKTIDSYRYAGELVAKISVLGDVLRVHLALDPDSYDVNKYHQLDLSSKSKYIFVPFTLKLKGEKSVGLALELIDELMTGFDIPANPSYKEKDFLAEIAKELEAESIK